jgi:hypothetical protein
MRHSRHRSFGVIGVAALTLGMILGGCGAPSTTRKAQAVVTHMATPSPTAAATATDSSSTTSSGSIPTSPGCPPLDTPNQPQYVAVGALKVSAPELPIMHDYSSELLPNGVPNAPYQIAVSAVNNFAPNPPVNPSLATGYEFQVCNPTGASHTVTSIRVTIASFTPSNGSLAIWHICGDGPYNAATKQTTPGCGGGTGGGDFLKATLPSDSVGATAPAIANGRGASARTSRSDCSSRSTG